jgi:hypothetical protein
MVVGDAHYDGISGYRPPQILAAAADCVLAKRCRSGACLALAHGVVRAR